MGFIMIKFMCGKMVSDSRDKQRNKLQPLFLSPSPTPIPISLYTQHAPDVHT